MSLPLIMPPAAVKTSPNHVVVVVFPLNQHTDNWRFRKSRYSTQSDWNPFANAFSIMGLLTWIPKPPSERNLHPHPKDLPVTTFGFLFLASFEQQDSLSKACRHLLRHNGTQLVQQTAADSLWLSQLKTSTFLFKFDRITFMSQTPFLLLLFYHFYGNNTKRNALVLILT